MPKVSVKLVTLLNPAVQPNREQEKTIKDKKTAQRSLNPETQNPKDPKTLNPVPFRRGSRSGASWLLLPVAPRFGVFFSRPPLEVET